MEVLVEECHEHSCQGSFKRKFNNLQRELLFEQPSHGKQMTEFFEGFHVFYDPVGEYIENLGSGNSWLYLYCKHKFIYYNLVPLGLSVLFFVKHEEKVGLWDHLLEWLHWKSEVT